MQHDIELTPSQITVLADWILTGDDAAPVLLAVDEKVLCVAQGDDRVFFDRYGEETADPNYEPTDEQIYNRPGVEGGIAYDMTDNRSEEEV